MWLAQLGIGIAIAIGVMVDASVVMVENMHKHKERDTGLSHQELVLRSAKEVGPALFFSLLIITLSFLPVFTLQAQEGRMFAPLAFTKTYAMAAAAGLSITLVPVLMGLFIRGRVLPEHRNPVNRLLVAVYRPVINLGFSGNGKMEPEIGALLAEISRAAEDNCLAIQNLRLPSVSRSSPLWYRAGS